MSEEQKLLLVLGFRNLDTEARLELRIYEPVPHRFFSNLINAWCEDLRSKIAISRDGKEEWRNVGGESWLAILLLALEFARRQIPAEEEEKWVDERGMPSWIILPKAVPISWGYALHRKLADQLYSEVAEFEKQIDDRRRQYEQNKSKE